MENKFKFYNTLTRNIDTVIPHEDGKIAMYTCGPTVYHYAHIGNLRSYIMEDVLEKSTALCGLRCKTCHEYHGRGTPFLRCGYR